MSPVGETTNPGLPTLESVPVAESRCGLRRKDLVKSFERQTDKILAVQSQTLAAVNTLGADVAELRTSHKQHTAWHKGTEHSRAVDRRAGGYWLQIISLILAASVLLGGVIWTVANLVR